MNITTALAHAYLHAGYRSPRDNPLFCRNCGACREEKALSKNTHFCRRHHFYVHALGTCPFCSPDEYHEQERQKERFEQQYLL